MLFTGPMSGALGARTGHKVALAVGGALATAGLLLLAVFHGSGITLCAGYLVLSMGIGFAFAAMPNLILGAVPQTQTGQATGFNALVRLVGSSLGGQVTAVVIASSAAAGSVVPRESGYVTAFVLCAVVAAAGGALALLVPASRDRRHVHVGDEIGAASPMPDVAFAADAA
jgi:MFS family permease